MLTVDEVGLKEAFFHLELLAMCFGIVQELMRLDGVGLVHLVIVVVQTHILGDASNAL